MKQQMGFDQPRGANKKLIQVQILKKVSHSKFEYTHVRSPRIEKQNIAFETDAPLYLKR